MAVLALAAGCRPPPPIAFEAEVAPRFVYDERPIAPGTRVFLVAGGDDVANFAAEIVAQRALWRAAGMRDDEIACYYAKPTEDAWLDDREQYEALLPTLARCHRAEPSRVHRDLERAAADRPPWIYVYVSAHGVPSQLGLAKASGSPRLQALTDRLGATERSHLDVATIGLQAGPGPRLGEVRRIAMALQRGDDPRDLMMTPWTLRESLAIHDANTQRIVVLQACFSGGFLSSARGTSLATLPNTVALTAAAADRASFGCEPGAARTHFGAAFELALGQALAEEPDPTHIDWSALYERVAFAVLAMEAVDDVPASSPQFVDTRSH